MSTTSEPSYGTTSNLTITLASLASESARESTAVENQASGKYLDVGLQFEFKLVNGVPLGVSPNGPVINVFAYVSIDGTTFSEPASGSDGLITVDPLVSQLRLLEAIPTPTDKAGGTWKCQITSLCSVLGFLPAKWGVVIENRTGLAFQASGYVAKYRGYKVVNS